jgi:hypothetical protein
LAADPPGTEEGGTLFGKRRTAAPYVLPRPNQRAERRLRAVRRLPAVAVEAGVVYIGVVEPTSYRRSIWEFLVG